MLLELATVVLRAEASVVLWVATALLNAVTAAVLKALRLEADKLESAVSVEASPLERATRELFALAAVVLSAWASLVLSAVIELLELTIDVLSAWAWLVLRTAAELCDVERAL